MSGRGKPRSVRPKCPKPACATNLVEGTKKETQQITDKNKPKETKEPKKETQQTTDKNKPKETKEPKKETQQITDKNKPKETKEPKKETQQTTDKNKPKETKEPKKEMQQITDKNKPKETKEPKKETQQTTDKNKPKETKEPKKETQQTTDKNKPKETKEPKKETQQITDKNKPKETKEPKKETQQTTDKNKPKETKEPKKETQQTTDKNKPKETKEPKKETQQTTDKNKPKETKEPKKETQQITDKNKPKETKEPKKETQQTTDKNKPKETKEPKKETQQTTDKNKPKETKEPKKETQQITDKNKPKETKEPKKETQQITDKNKPKETKEPKQPKHTTKGIPPVPQECVEVKPESRMVSLDSNPDKILFTTLDQLKIKKKDTSESASIVNSTVKLIMDHMKKNTQCFKDVNSQHTGSYYENLKISNPDEFDVMLTVPVERVDIRPFGDDGAFYSVAFKRGKHSLDCFLDENYTISASGMLTEFRKEVTKCVKKLKDVKLEKKKKGCPAVTLLINGTETVPISLDIVLGLEVSPYWPTFTKGGIDKIDTWLGTKVKREQKNKGYFLVPKYEGRGTVEREGVLARDVWRISFSHVEKNILKNHGSQKTCCEASGTRCCRKDCLKLLKHLLGLLKAENPSLSKFCSYHAKTTLLHACCSRTQDSDWEAAQLVPCFLQLLGDFEGHLKDGMLPNFFIPTHNLLGSGQNRKSCQLLAQRINEERNNGFPIFRK